MKSDDARLEGYREGRAAVWREIRDWAAENLAIAEEILGHPIVTADDVLGILAADESGSAIGSETPENPSPTHDEHNTAGIGTGVDGRA